MKLLLLTICCVITTSLAGPVSETEEKLEAALNNVEELLQDMKKNEASSLVTANNEGIFGDIEKPVPKIPKETFTDTEELGDIPKPDSMETMEEVLLHTENIERAAAEIEAVGGRISIQMGDNVLIANLPSNVAAMQDTFAHASPRIPSTASKKVQNKVEIFKLYREDKLKPPPKVQKWTEKTAPLAYPQLKPLEANSPYTLTMRGKIAVALVVPSGPGYLAFTQAEYNKVVSEVLVAINFWRNNAPRNAGLSFVLYDWGPIISAPDGRPGCFEAGCHDVFAIPALRAIGATSRDNLAATVKSWAGAVGAYIGFVSKYRQHHFAYAYFGGGPLYMQYSNDGWGPDQIDRVFAHETGHVFNAPDEYTNCQCYQQYGRGYCSAGNNNCRGNDATACTAYQQPCIMDKNDLTNICLYTRKHIGWC